MSKENIASHLLPVSMSSKNVCVAWAVETPRLPPNCLGCSCGDMSGYNFLQTHRMSKRYTELLMAMGRQRSGSRQDRLPLNMHNVSKTSQQ